MKNLSFRDKVFPSITGEGSLDWSRKLKEINSLEIKQICIFLSRFDKKERSNLYRLLLKSKIKEIPFVHLRDDMEAKELDFFINNYNTRFFNAHEDSFLQDEWKDYRDKIYLEMDYNNKIEKAVEVKRAAGFCVDLAHFRASVARGTKEASYTYLKRKGMRFGCNHIGGYDPAKMDDKHRITGLKDFNYLITLPKFLFGEVLAIEADNSIKEQLEFKEYIIKILNDYFSRKTE
ncbi:MAG: hypothetical protein WC302_02200 [Candidatus Paceibacterota bacterium]|jgi:hypothetical protein